MTAPRARHPGANQAPRPRVRGSPGRGRGVAGAWRRCRRGVAATEFALVAPILAVTLLTSIDLGRALTERMAIDHALRAGAQRAMADPGAASVLDVMRTTAKTNFTLADDTAETGEPTLDLSVARFGACPDNPGYAVAPSTVCAGSTPTYIYYRMEATKTYAGWITPAIEFDRASQVQIR